MGCRHSMECDEDDTNPQKKILIRTSSSDSFAPTYTDGRNVWNYTSDNSINHTYKLHLSDTKARIKRVHPSFLTVREDEGGVCSTPYFTTRQENQRRSFPHYHQSFDYDGKDPFFNLSFKTVTDRRNTTCYFTVNMGPSFGGVTTTAEAPPTNTYTFQKLDEDDSQISCSVLQEVVQK
ncbi:hypothetical protein GBAR_LOCUS22353 [Geodia barretti]|uniref:Uncharacterized protein n=1 Tax=Geodia barretti TaxID=519541 RepID=A0AA35T347_GEOBA|nr:hypothetical protein GBAR_LOCUS22353 [Geodia barretti]